MQGHHKLADLLIIGQLQTFISLPCSPFSNTTKIHNRSSFIINNIHCRRIFHGYHSIATTVPIRLFSFYLLLVFYAHEFSFLSHIALTMLKTAPILCHSLMSTNLTNTNIAYLQPYLATGKILNASKLLVPGRTAIFCLQDIPRHQSRVQNPPT